MYAELTRNRKVEIKNSTSQLQGKTYLTAVFCVLRAILFPQTKIIAAAGQKSQSREIIGKIKEIMADSPLLQREISDIKESANDPRVEFHNGSWIRIVAANDGARGARSNLLIVDRLVHFKHLELLETP